jgi:hypothetical protein
MTGTTMAGITRRVARAVATVMARAGVAVGVVGVVAAAVGAAKLRHSRAADSPAVVAAVRADLRLGLAAEVGAVLRSRAGARVVGLARVMAAARVGVVEVVGAAGGTWAEHPVEVGGQVRAVRRVRHSRPGPPRLRRDPSPSCCTVRRVASSIRAS